MPDQKTTTNSDDIPRGGQGFPAENKDGSPALVGPDDYTRYVQMKRLDPNRPRHAATGNLADLDRLGKLATGSSSPADAFVIAPHANVDEKDVVTPAERDAFMGIYNTETARTGLVDAPPLDQGGDGHTEAVVRDPGSQSPEVVSEGKVSHTSTTATSAPGSSTVKK